MSELFTSGSVGGGAGNCPFYPAGDVGQNKKTSIYVESQPNLLISSCKIILVKYITEDHVPGMV